MACMVSRSGRELQRYDTQGRRQVVGCVPYRYKNCSHDELEILLISSQKGGQGMMFPKGGWELDESVEEAASRESLEEAGVLGNVQDELGKWNFLSKRHGTFYEGYMFPLLVTEQLDFWPESHVRQRIWLPVAEARDACRHWWMKEALDILVRRLTFLQQEKDENVNPCAQC
ncbi:nudix hydrolase 18, mitochondrial [Mercurialis annua]|uniref:nudix hydrolase 18, mitochondrial n=1 Tax=Mercurialis annua TaxID=3986 RepID=UPI00215FA39B|nr:nudix hydrolase 18, mitochondrial [Mercurialis annua]